jgi:hypothetical protein
MARRIIKTFEEFVSFEIEDSTVHIHVGSEETETSTGTTSGDEVIVDVPMMHLSQNDTSDYGEEEDEEEDETPESDVDENEDDE